MLDGKTASCYRCALQQTLEALARTYWNIQLHVSFLIFCDVDKRYKVYLLVEVPFLPHSYKIDIF